jgi:hypothetical protein
MVFRFTYTSAIIARHSTAAPWLDDPTIERRLTDPQRVVLFQHRLKPFVNGRYIIEGRHSPTGEH